MPKHGSWLNLVENLFSKMTRSISDLKNVLGTNVAVTVFPKLRVLDYLTSYSQRGAYYSLAKLLASMTKAFGPTSPSASRVTGRCWRPPRPS